MSNSTIVVGSEGSIEAPYLASAATAFTDAIGGDVNGCFGFNRDTGGLVNTLEARINAAWVSVALTGTIFQSRIQFDPKSGALFHPGQTF